MTGTHSPGTSYDRIAYPSSPLSDARPSRIAAIASLLEFQAAPPDQCRVLQLGAGDGAHLIPLALAHPKSHFVGVDLAGTAIARGKASIRELGLENVLLEQADLTTFTSKEPFDYVLANGVYSWVAPDVQRLLLASCQRLLAPHGLAYVGYATYPGCHQREMVRDMMRFHVARLAPESNVVAEGQAFARFVRQYQIGGDAYGSTIEQELLRMHKHGAEYAFHDDFSEHNSPVYFSDFVQQAREQRLDFFSESLFLFFHEARLPLAAARAIEEISGKDLVAREQYLDFLRGRSFRQTLLCHAGARPTTEWKLSALLQLNAASALKSKTPDLRLDSGTAEVFVSDNGVGLSSDKPIARAALRALGGLWPGSLPIHELCALAEEHAGQGGAENQTLLLSTLLRAAAAKLVELDSLPPRVAVGVSEQPRASRLARAQAHTGPAVTNLWHRRVTLDNEASRHLLTLLDGKRSHTELAKNMAEFLATLPMAEHPTFAKVEDELHKVLTGFSRSALLEA
jgi:methyltransferase-like protein/cyclopropane fatty-acyl-phospholipid synthase-like methyltransferase